MLDQAVTVDLDCAGRDVRRRRARTSKASRASTVHLVGAEPVDPEMLTVEAVRAIRQTTVQLVDNLAGGDVLRFAQPSARIIRVGDGSERVEHPPQGGFARSASSWSANEYVLCWG